MKTTCIALLLFTTSMISKAKTDSTYRQPQRNSIFLELGGTSVTYGLCYERIFHLSPQSRIGTRLGIGGIYLLMAPFYSTEINLILGKKHAFETGFGFGKGFHEVRQIIDGKVGYRFQGRRGFLFRFA